MRHLAKTHFLKITYEKCEVLSSCLVEVTDVCFISVYCEFGLSSSYKVYVFPIAILGLTESIIAAEETTD